MITLGGAGDVAYATRVLFRWYALAVRYKRLLDQCMSEEKDIYNRLYNRFHQLRRIYESDVENDIYYFSKKIFEKIEYSCKYFITISAGIGMYVELFVINNVIVSTMLTCVIIIIIFKNIIKVFTFAHLSVRTIKLQKIQNGIANCANKPDANALLKIVT